MKAKLNELKINLKNWVVFCAFCRFYPDLFLDMIKPKKGGINFHLDQRILLRTILRFFSVYGVFPRGWAKTMVEVLAGILICIFYPRVSIAITAQTKENAADLLQSKFNELIRFYPMLKNEIEKCSFTKGRAEIWFKNGSHFDILVNGQQSKGQRRHRINIEESALLNNELYEDALAPIVNIGRNTVGTAAIVDPCELNHQINFFTTSGFRGSDEYIRSVEMVKDMINLKGKIVLGAGWELACWYGRGLSKSAILEKKENMSSVAFAQNYESKWVGVADSALVDINKLLMCRTLIDPVLLSNNDNEEYFIGVDVARSESTANNQSSAAIIRVKRNSAKKVIALELVNTIGISNTQNFTGQAIEVKRLKNAYKARMVIVDGNGLILVPVYSNVYSKTLLIAGKSYLK